MYIALVTTCIFFDFVFCLYNSAIEKWLLLAYDSLFLGGSLWCSFSVHAIHMGEKVTEVFEFAIKTLSRKDDISDSR